MELDSTRPSDPRWSELTRIVVRKPPESEDICAKHGCPKKIYPCGWNGETEARCDACDAEVQEAEKQAMMYALQLHRARCRAKIPPKYADLTLGQLLQRPCPPEQEVALNKLGGWGKLVKEPNWLNLTVIGDKGTGKTEMLSALLGSMIHAGVDCKYTTCNDMLQAVKATWKSKDMLETAAVAEYVAPHLLVLDEISGADRDGSERLAAREVYLIETLIDERYRQRKKTVFAGNIKTFADFVALVGERVASRAQENGVVIVCSWPPHRKWAEKEAFEEAVKKSGVRLC